MGDNSGCFTCRNASVVDYVITSANLLKCVSGFDILEFSNLFSDVHTPVSVSLRVQKSMSDENISTQNIATDEKIKKWDCYAETEFRNNILLDEVNALNDKINILSSENVEQNDINGVMSDICNIMLESAKHLW